MTKLDQDNPDIGTAPPPVATNGTDGLTRRLIIITIAFVAALATYLLLPPDVNELARRTAAIFIIAAIFWATEVLPLYATSLLVIGLLVLALAKIGGLADVLPAVAEMPEEAINYSQFLQTFGSPIIILFMGGFLLSAAMSKHGIDRTLAARFLQPLTRSPLRLVFGVLIMTAFFSMWMSNTATAAMMLAIIAPILRSLPEKDRFHRGLILAVPLGANIGGIGTPIGTPPNAIAFGALNRPDTGYEVTFLGWMVMAVPLAILLLTFVGFLLYFIYRPRTKLRLKPVEPPKKITRQGRLTLAVLIAAILLWLTGEWTGLPAAGVALLAAVALTVFGALGRKDLDTLDWNILVLMWGGLALGQAIGLSGLSDLVEEIDFAGLPGGAMGVAVVIVALSVGMSTFMSNTATAALLVPIVLAMSVAGPITQGELAVLTALACSFAMALPVSTPPNAIAFATGKLPAQSLLRVGGAVCIVSVIVLLLGFRIMIPATLDLGPGREAAPDPDENGDTAVLVVPDDPAAVDAAMPQRVGWVERGLPSETHHPPVRPQLAPRSPQPRHASQGDGSIPAPPYLIL